MIKKILIFLGLFLNGYLTCAQGPCVVGNIYANSTSICKGNSSSFSLSIPNGTIQWQQSNDGVNWTNVTSGNSSTSATSGSTATVSFSYTRTQQNYTIPSGVTTIVAAGIGAAGGHGSSDFNGRGGLGGRLVSSLTVTPGEILSIFVGQIGGNTVVAPGTGKQADNLWVTGDAKGGFNGGGNSNTGGAGGGGGATDIRRGGNTLADRVFVVGSGGGGGNQRRIGESGGNGGNGGGATGANGVAGSGGGGGGNGGTNSTGGNGGAGATNGTLGQGGDGATVSRNGGGGGAGYYGGGGGGFVNDKAGGGGGGGSSFSSGSITTNTQGYSTATGNGSLTISYSAPAQTTSIYSTPNLFSNIYYRAEVSDISCSTAYTTPVYISVIDAPSLTSSAGTDSQTAAINNPISNITYSATNGISISNDGVAGANGLPLGVSASFVSNAITILGTPTSSGVYNYSIPLTSNCGITNVSGTITVANLSATLNNFNDVTKIYFDGSFTITPPNTDSTGAFSYVSSDTNVATISGTTVTIVAAGVSTITATQDADATHLSTTISADLNVKAVTVVTKNGEITNIKPNYVNKIGAIGTSSGVGVNGEIKLTKTSSITLFTQVTIPFEEYFDLEAGSLCGGSCFDIVTSNYDLVFAAGGGTIRARMWWNNQYTDMAMVYDKSFDNLSSADIANYYYCDYIGDPNLSCINVDTPPTDFVGIYHTNSGNYYAVQYLSEDTSGVTFKYKRLN